MFCEFVIYFCADSLGTKAWALRKISSFVEYIVLKITDLYFCSPACS